MRQPTKAALYAEIERLRALLAPQFVEVHTPPSSTWIWVIRLVGFAVGVAIGRAL